MQHNESSRTELLLRVRRRAGSQPPCLGCPRAVAFSTRAVRAPYSFLALYRRFFSAPKWWVGGWSEGAHIYSFSGARQTKAAEASCRALRSPPDRAPVPRRARGGPARCSVELHTLGAGGKREEGIGTFLSMAFYSALPVPTLPRAVSRARTLLCPWRCCWRCALTRAAGAAHRFEIRRRCWLATAGSRNEQRAPSRCGASGGLCAVPGFAAAGGVPWVPLLPFALLLSGVGCCCFSCKLGAAASSFHSRGECRIDAARRRLGFHETDSWC